MTRNVLGHDESNVFIVDIESDDLSAAYDPLARVYLVGVMNVETGVYSVFHSVSDFLLAHLTGTLVFHNASFDVPALRLRGATIPNYFCTMVGSHTLHPESSEYHSLGSLQPDVKKTLRDLLEENGYKFHGVKKGEEYTWYGKGDDNLDALVEEYLVRDLTATRNEYLRQVDEYSTTPAKLLDVLLSVNMPYIERVISMEQGIQVVYNDDVANVLSEATERSYRVCLETAGYIPNPAIVEAGRVPYPNAGYKTDGDSCQLKAFNPNSNAHVIGALQRLYQWEPKVLTSAGNSSVASEVLESLDYPLCDALLEYGKSTKLMSFCGALKECNGWIRPSYNQCATRTTRLSSSKPNIQQVPARDKTGKQLHITSR
jgi:DNA polymerase I-like protein with 3'-5' exonuclease and polymerase domains